MTINRGQHGDDPGPVSPATAPLTVRQLELIEAHHRMGLVFRDHTRTLIAEVKRLRERDWHLRGLIHAHRQQQ